MQWTTRALDELGFLAGRVPPTEIAEYMGCSLWSVISAAKRNEISLRTPTGFQWCIWCKRWRTRTKSGKCRICTVNANTERISGCKRPQEIRLHNRLDESLDPRDIVRNEVRELRLANKEYNKAKVRRFRAKS